MPRPQLGVHADVRAAIYRFRAKAAQQVNMADRRNPNCEAVRRWPWGRWLDCRPSCRSPALIARRRQPLRDRPSGRLIDEEAARMMSLFGSEIERRQAERRRRREEEAEEAERKMKHPSIPKDIPAFLVRRGRRVQG